MAPTVLAHSLHDEAILVDAKYRDTGRSVSVVVTPNTESALQASIAAQEDSVVVPLVIVPPSSTPLSPAVESASASSSRSISPLPSRGRSRGKRRAVDPLGGKGQQKKQKLVEAFKKIREGINLLEEALA
ncbi:hypothetical protein FGG08_005058 [Glutinoglossum americanum]|uniref:Uncharacterized protein n=1 Tax=Glutinoglossum americanum TaxID=1670608 RepID=A0A9P8KYX4_9PEZI|nr:hypothetical protein FGG08_005058 [Glutinoglossum americanum]